MSTRNGNHVNVLEDDVTTQSLRRCVRRHDRSSAPLHDPPPPPSRPEKPESDRRVTVAGEPDRCGLPTGPASGRICGAILAAGLGTRLHPLTHRVPKPAVTICGVPLVAFAFARLAAAGARTVGINAYHLSDRLRSVIDGLPRVSPRLAAVEAKLIVEGSLLGTGGGLRGIADALPETTLVAVNSDALFDFDLEPYVAQHRQRGAMATLVLRRVPTGSPFPSVAVGPDGRIHRIAEVVGSAPDPVDGSLGAYTGIQIVEPELLSAIPRSGPSDVIRTAYRRRLAEAAPIFGAFAPDDGMWLDVGTIDRYLEANWAVLERVESWPFSLPIPDGQSRRIDPSAQVDAGAKLRGPCLVLASSRIAAGAVVGPNAVIGPGAVLQPGSVVRSSVVWAGANVVGTHDHAVVLPQ